MFAKSTLLRLFPTFVWVFDINREDAEPLSTAIAEIVEGALPEQQGLRQRFSMQSGTHLHELSAFQPLVDYALTAGQQILKFLEHKPAELFITGCWATVSDPGASHLEHSHPNNFLSGVYYVKVPDGGDSINFHDPRAQAHVIAPHVTCYSPKHASEINVQVQPGRMVMFPAWLRHSVDPNRGHGRRISVAFNLMISDYTAQQSRTRFKGQFLIKDDT